MHDPNLHNDPSLNEQYPAPLIPVEQAWAAMSQQLELSTPAPKTPRFIKRLFPGTGFIWVLALLFVLIASIKLLPENAGTRRKKGSGQQLPNNPSGTILPAQTSEPVTENSPLTRYSDIDLQLSQPTTQTPHSPSITSPNHSIQNRSEEKTESSAPITSSKTIFRKQKKHHQPISIKTHSTSVQNGLKEKKTNPLSSQNKETFYQPNEAIPPYLGKAALLHQPLPQPTPPSSEAYARVAGRILPSRSDSLTAVASPKTTHTKRKKNTLQLGLDWAILLPTQSTQYYLQNSAGKTAFYQPLLPGIWVGYELAKNQRIRITVNPWQTYQAGKTLLDTAIVHRTSPDTLAQRIETRLAKTTSLQIGLQYQFSFAPNWSVGIGLNWHQQRRALLYNETIQLNDNKTLPDSSFSIRPADSSWQHLKPAYFTGNLEVSYQWNKLQIGAVLLLPITSPTRSSTQKPFNTQVFVRWRIR